MFLFLIIVTTLMVSFIFRSILKPRNYPPGPSWCPFFGTNNIISGRMAKHGSQWKVISEMLKEYSTNILGLKMGSELVVVVKGEKNIRQVVSEKEFDARPDSFFLRLRTFGKRSGITFMDGTFWREHRPFILKHFKNNGFGKQMMETQIHEQVEYILNILHKSNGHPINIKMTVSMVIINIMWKYVAGEHLKEHKLKQFIELMSRRSKVFTMAGGFLNQWPWLRYIMPDLTGYKIIEKLNEQILEIIENAITRHKNKTVQEDDLINAYLREMDRNKMLYTEDQLIGICVDILIAAASTTASALDFAIIALLRHPDAQQKIYYEITKILGDNPPTWSDSGSLIYTTAFMNEVQRTCTIAPFAGGRRTLEDVAIDGYYIPKGTTVLISLGDLHTDEQHWDEPDQFKPERFIDDCGALKTSTQLYPFSLGRRRCLGEPLARSFLFTAFVSIVQKYKIECIGPPPTSDPIIGILAEPVHFTAKFAKRQCLNH